MKTDPDDSLTSDNTQLSPSNRHGNERTGSLAEPLQLQSIALGAPSVEVTQYLAAATSENTRRAYRDDLADFTRFGGSVPTSPEFIAQYVTFRAPRCSSYTIARRLVGIGRAHTSQGLPDPTKSDLVRAVLRGVRRTHGSEQRRAKPLTVEELLISLPQGDDVGTVRDRSLLLLGFASALRRSELVSLDIEDLQFVSDGLLLNVKRSKTDPTGNGRAVAVPHGRSERACPVRATRDWLDAIGRTTGPLFRPVNKAGRVGAARLSASAVSSSVKKSVSGAGIDPDGYSGHSLRAGLITSAARAGVSLHKIMEQSGHRSVQMLTRYIRDAKLFEANAAGAVL